MRCTSWSLFQKLASLMRISMQPVPVPVTTTPRFVSSRFFGRRDRHDASRRVLAHRRHSRLMPRSSLGRSGRMAVSQPM
jgi:hypothetical protein